MCAGRRPLQAASRPDWVGHDAMMISFTITRVSKSRNFALRASILAVSTRPHGRGHKESNDLGLGQIALNLKILSLPAIHCRLDEVESFITDDDKKNKNQNDRGVWSPSKYFRLHKI